MTPKEKVAKLAALEVPCEPQMVPDTLPRVHAPDCDGGCHGTGTVPKYEELWEECSGVPTIYWAQVNGPRYEPYIKQVHQVYCCDGSGRRLVSPRLAAMVLLEIKHFTVVSRFGGWAALPQRTVVTAEGEMTWDLHATATEAVLDAVLAMEEQDA